MNTAILSTGDELVHGQTVDTNSCWLSQRQIELGLSVTENVVLGDDKSRIIDTLRRLASCNDVLLCSGGLGPTKDDLTRFAIAELLGVELELDEVALGEIESIFTRYGRVMSESNRMQALMPKGCGVIPNSCGTAPGIKAVIDGCHCYFMPGVPKEMKQMYDSFVIDDLRKAFPEMGLRVIKFRTLLECGLGESILGEKLGELMDRGRNPQINTNAGNGMVKLRIRAISGSEAEADVMLAETERQVRERLEEYIFGTDDDTLAKVVCGMLAARNETLATVESCTGGLIAKSVTDVAGSSKIYLGGWCVYSNKLKVNQMRVGPDTLEKYGAVSEQVACELAINAREISGADYALSTTGIAGPGGGTEEKPVGLVYIALAGPGGYIEVRETRQFGDRDGVRLRSTHSALEMLRRKLLKS